MAQEMTNKRVQNDARISSAERTGIEPTGEMTNKQVQNDACIDSAERTGIEPIGENIPNVTFDELVVEVEKSLKDMHKELRRQRNKYGEQYNYKNNYEQLNRRFGEDPRKLIDEYILILDKKSNHPVAVREPIKAIVATAINRLIAAKIKAATKQEQSSSLELPSESRLAKPKKQRKQTNPKNRLSESNVKRV